MAFTLVTFAAPAGAHHCRTATCLGNTKLKPKWPACRSITRGNRAFFACEVNRAARHYHQPPGAARAVAWCESRWRWWISGHHQGAWQFLWSTWRTTPYRGRSPHDAKWSSLAAMWMWSKGRRGEWAC